MKVGAKGQIVIPKMLREVLGVECLEVNRKPVARDVSRYILENEFDESLS